MSKEMVIGKRKMKPRFIFFILTISIFALLVFRNFNSPSITHIVESGEMDLTYNSEALLIRNAEIYNAPEYGWATYYANEGEYVHSEDLVATIFKADYQEEMVNQLYNIQEKIVNYQRKSILTDIVDHDIDNIQSKVDELVYKMQTAVKEDTVDDLTRGEKEFRDLLEQRQQLIERESVPDSYLQKLKEEETKISQQLNEWKIDIMAPRSGLISYQVDSLEDILTFDSLGELNLNIYRDLINWRIPDDKDKKNEQVDVGSPFFRVVEPEKWYIACEIKFPKSFFKEDENISISFLDFEDEVLMGTVDKIIDENNAFLLIIGFSEEMEEFLNTRNTSVKLHKSIYGLAIPKEAIFKRKGNEGVFKIEGNETIFTEVDIIGESDKDDYVIIDEETSSIKEGDSLKLN